MTPATSPPPGVTPELYDQLVRHEGLRLKPYRDTAGKLTIGVGRNLDDVGVSEMEAMVLLAADTARAESGLDERLPWWRGLDPVRRDVLVDMAFNLGIAKLVEFTTTLAAVREGRFPAAAEAMLRSAWAGQVKGRAIELAAMMRTGARVGGGGR